jgi:RNA polymerase sigma-70 factor (ECF subfamily)
MAWRMFQQESDEALAALYCATGDERAYNEIYARHQSRVLGICRQLLRNRADAEDVAQRVFLKLSLHIRSFDSGSFAAWIGRIARNESLNHLRSACVRHERRSLDDLPQSAGARDPEFADFDLIAAVNRLPFVQRASLKLFYGMGLSYDEIASQLEVDPGRVKSAIQNGRRNLKKALNVSPKVQK